jgi:serine/threonine-protein kinase
MEGSIPTAIGRYAVERLLGAGAMGNVYLARDPHLDRQVAIKTVKRLDLDPEQLATFLSRFRNEARAAARLVHPNIVQVYDVGEDPEGGPFLVMEYVPGASLKQMLRREGPLVPGALVLLADEMGEALAAAHAQGIIHRDLKPDNLLMTPDGHVKLADFGVARIPDAALTREGQFLGTPCYSAPETLKAGVYGPETDLFSMAAVLYEAATAERAFPGADAIAVAHEVLHGEPEAPSHRPAGGDIPPELDEVILRGLARAASDRYESPRELAQAVREAYEAAGVPAELPPPPPGREPSGAFVPARHEGRGPSSLTFAAVALGALGIGLAVVLGFRTEEPRADASALPPEAVSPSIARPTPRHEPLAPVEPPLMPEAAPRHDAGSTLSAVPSVEPPPDEPPAEEVAPPDLDALTPHEREEHAKDALGRARRALREGRLDAARAALVEAGYYDPGNPDIARLMAQVEASAPR